MPVPKNSDPWHSVVGFEAMTTYLGTAKSPYEIEPPSSACTPAELAQGLPPPTPITQAPSSRHPFSMGFPAQFPRSFQFDPSVLAEYHTRNIPIHPKYPFHVLSTAAEPQVEQVPVPGLSAKELPASAESRSRTSLFLGIIVNVHCTLIPRD